MPKKKPPTEQIRVSVPKGMSPLLAAAAVDTWKAEGTQIELGGYVVRALALALITRRKCPACVAGVVCKLHGPEAVAAAMAELGLVEVAPEPDPPDPDRENIKLSDLWIAKWLEHYGTAKEKAAGKLDRRPLTVVHFRAIAAARIEHGFALLRDAIEGVFANPFYTVEHKAVPDILAVMRNPSKFAAMRAKPAKKGSGQGAPEGWSP